MTERPPMIVTLPGGLRVDADYQGHHISTDQPKEDGGDGSAPEPFVLFLASIGTCAGYYVLKFCQARDLPTDGVRLVQRMERDPQTGALLKVVLDVELPAGFPEKYRTAVVRAAGQCTVKRTIDSTLPIETRASIAPGGEE